MSKFCGRLKVIYHTLDSAYSPEQIQIHALGEAYCQPVREDPSDVISKTPLEGHFDQSYRWGCNRDLGGYPCQWRTCRSFHASQFMPINGCHSAMGLRPPSAKRQ